MFEYLQQLSFWDWLALGTVLLILEVFGGAGYLLWMGLIATAVGVLNFLLPGLSWSWQFLLFVLLSALSAYLWWKRQSLTRKQKPQVALNEPGQALIGRDFLLLESSHDGHGKIRVGDGVWLVTGPQLPPGSWVRVVAQQGVVLEVIASPTA